MLASRTIIAPPRIKIENTTIVNVYHPPQATLDATSLPIPTKDFMAAGDLNCRHEN